MASGNQEEQKDDKLLIVTEVYRPLLLRVLDVKDILEFMKGHFQQDDQMFNEFKEECQADRTPREKIAERFMDILHEKPDQQGIFRAFLDALEHTGQDTLVGHIEGTCNFDTKEREHYRYLLGMFANRLDTISPENLLDHIANCLTDRDQEAIKAKIQSDGEMSGAAELLLRLDRKSDKWFDPFVKGLEAYPGSQQLGKELREAKEFIFGKPVTEDDGDNDIGGGVQRYHMDNKTNEVNEESMQDVEELVLRPDQERVAAEAMRGENSIVILPTGSGKTEVAIAVMKHCFLRGQLGGASNFPDPKIVFVVNKVPLVKQQKERCERYLGDRCRVAGMSGEETMEVSLSSVLSAHHITVLTAQILVNALRDRESGVKLSDISFMVLDECHHCQKSNPYNVLMAMYRDEKLGSRRPQILGLTASPGVGSSKNMREAEDHIIRLCANLDSRIAKGSKVSRQTASIREVQRIVPGRSLEDPYFRAISGVMAEIEGIIMATKEGQTLTTDPDELIKLGSIKHGQQAYEQAVVTLTRKIKQYVEEGDQCRNLTTCVTFLREYNNSLYINRDIQTCDAIDYMEQYISQEERSRPSGRMDLQLIKQFREILPKLKTFAGLASSANPVLMELKANIQREYEEKPESLGIVFSKTRVSARAMVRWLNEDPDLLPHGLEAAFLIGGGSQGMSASAQSTLIDMFKDGKCKIVVATSVAEEGLDIKACNLVFRYNYVTSDIGHVQTKGRGRAFNGKVFVIINANLQLQERELRNIIKVNMMEDTVKTLTSMDKQVLLQRMVVEQKEDRKVRQKEEESRNALKARKVKMSDVTFQCVKCREPVCSNDDIRTINGQHHVVSNDLFLNKVTLVPLKKQPLIDGFLYKQEILCNKCQKKFGTMVIYRTTELPLIAVKNFILKDSKGKIYICKRWKEVPFEIKSIAIEDLLKQMNISSEDGVEEGEESDDENNLLEYSNIMQPE